MECTGCSIVLPKAIDGNETLDDGVLRIAGFSIPPFIEWTDLGDGTIRLEGPLVIFVTTISRFLKARVAAQALAFSADVAIALVKPVAANPVGLSYGLLQKNGTVDGVFGYIQRKKADIFAALSAPNLARDGYFDYHTPVSIEEIRLVTIKPSSFIDPWGFVSAFEPTVWYFTIGTLLVYSICCAFLHKLDKQLPGRDDEVSRGIFEYIWFWFSRLFAQPDFTPRRFWLRWCAIMFMLPTSLMLINALEGDLKGSLVFKNEADHVNYFADIFRFRGMRMVSEKSSVLTTMFTRSGDPFMVKLAERLDERRGLFSGEKLDLLIEEILNRKVVVLTAHPLAKSIITTVARQTGRCPNVKASAGYITTVTIAMPMGLHLPKHIRERIQNAVFRILESSVYHQALSSRVHLATRCDSRPRAEGEPLEALGVSDLEGVIYLYSIGSFASLLAFVAEIIWTHTRRAWCIRTRQHHV